MDIIWTSFGHHLGIIWISFGDHLEMIRGSFRSHLGIMFREIDGRGSGGRSPPVKQVGLGGARPPKITEWKNNDFHVVIS